MLDTKIVYHYMISYDTYGFIMCYTRTRVVIKILRSYRVSRKTKTLDMEIFLSKKSEIRPPLPSELWTLIAPKLLKIKGSFFLPIKIWEICGHLQLVSCLYLHWSLCDSILKKSFQKSPLQEVAKCLHFWNFGKSASFWLAIALKPLGQFQITRYQ